MKWRSMLWAALGIIATIASIPARARDYDLYPAYRGSNYDFGRVAYGGSHYNLVPGPERPAQYVYTAPLYFYEPPYDPASVNSGAGDRRSVGLVAGILSAIGLIVWSCIESEKKSDVTDDLSDADRARGKIEMMGLKQQLRAQRNHGDEYHDLEWRKKLGEQVLHVAEQEAILDEHRQRLADRSQRGREQLLTQRAELRADGFDTSEIDAALLEKGGRS